MNIEDLMRKTDEVWKFIADVLDNNEMSGEDCFNMMLTIHARYVNGAKRQSEKTKMFMIEEYIKVLEEKLGINERR